MFKFHKACQVMRQCRLPFCYITDNPNVSKKNPETVQLRICVIIRREYLFRIHKFEHIAQFIDKIRGEHCLF